MVSEIVTVSVAEGLHARPAAEFAKLCAMGASQVKVGKPDFEGVRGDSILSLMTLAVKCGDKLLIQVNGDDEHQLLERLKAVVSDSISH